MTEIFTPLFTGGSGRSGTTIIINMLKHHPEIHASLPREIKYLTSRFGIIDLNFGRPITLEEDFYGVRNNLVARIFPLIGKPKEKLFRESLQGPWWSETGKKGKARGLVQGVTREQLLSAITKFEEEYKADPMQASRNFYFQLSQDQFKKSGIKYFADSTPVNMMQADFIFKLFPTGKFINMVRDGRDVAMSVSKEKWGPNNPHEALDWWSNRLLVAAKALSQVPPEQKIEMRLEDLTVLNREQEYSRLLNFLHIEDSAAMRLYFENEVSPEKMTQGSWKQEVKDPKAFDLKYKKILGKLQSKGVVVQEFY